jgi:hypothetical protein
LNVLSFVSSLRADEDFDKFYQEAVDKVGQPVSRADRSTTIDNFILK